MTKKVDETKEILGQWMWDVGWKNDNDWYQIIPEFVPIESGRTILLYSDKRDAYISALEQNMARAQRTVRELSYQIGLLERRPWWRFRGKK